MNDQPGPDGPGSKHRNKARSGIPFLALSLLSAGEAGRSETNCVSSRYQDAASRLPRMGCMQGSEPERVPPGRME